MMNESVDVRGGTMQEAVSVLQRRLNKYNDEGFVENWGLTVKGVFRSEYEEEEEEEDEQDNNNVWWDRFVTLLLQESSKIRLEAMSFRRSLLDRRNDQVLEHLFRDVLPNLVSVNEMTFFACRILPAYMNMYLTSLINNNNNNNINLQSLEIGGIQLHSSSVALIAQLLSSSCANKYYGDGRRNHGQPIMMEHLSLCMCSIDSTGCELIIKALDGNTCLKSLDLRNNDISEISLEAATALGNNNKTLSSIVLHTNPLSEQSLCHLANGLRTNHSLKKLGLEDATDSQLVLNAFAELLKTFNYRLFAVFGLDKLQEKDKLLRHNRRISLLYDHLLERNINNNNTTTTRTTNTDSTHHLPELFLWPRTLEIFGSKPSLIFRFIRHGNLVSFTNQVLSCPAEFATVVGAGVKRRRC